MGLGGWLCSEVGVVNSYLCIYLFLYWKYFFETNDKVCCDYVYLNIQMMKFLVIIYM